MEGILREGVENIGSTQGESRVMDQKVLNRERTERAR